MSGEMDRYFHSRRALKKRVDEQNAEITTLRGQIRDLQRTVAFFASVIKSGEGWTEQCDRAWPVTLEPCAHDFHRAEHGVMPCTKCGAEAHAAHIRSLAPSPSSAAKPGPWGDKCICGHPKGWHLGGGSTECLETVDDDGNVFCGCGKYESPSSAAPKEEPDAG